MSGVDITGGLEALGRRAYFEAQSGRRNLHHQGTKVTKVTKDGDGGRRVKGERQRPQPTSSGKTPGVGRREGVPKVPAVLGVLGALAVKVVDVR